MTVPSQAVLTLFSGARSRGTFQGYFAAASIGGRSFSPLVGLWTFDVFSGAPQYGWYAIAAATGLLAVGFYRLAEPLQRDFRALGRTVEGRQVARLGDLEGKG
jgi:MFS family permease